MPLFTSFIQTPAKVNLGLKVVRRRVDGYHDIYSVMEPVSLSDSLYCEFKAASKNSFSLQCPQLRGLSSDQNLVIKAARMMLEIARERDCERVGRWDFFLDKRVPTGAGLGGGSSNAAGVIKLLNRFYNLTLNDSEMVKAATRIGADVPFFLNPGLSLVEGIGECVTLLGPSRPRYYLLVKPPFSINTAWAYSALPPVCGNSFINYDVEQFLVASTNNSYLLENDFEKPVMDCYPLLAEIKEWLMSEGGGTTSLMSGSGSVIYAIYPDLESAIKGEIAARKKFAGCDCQFYVVRNLINISKV